MIRFLTIPEEDILADPASAGDLVLHAVRRGRKYSFQSLVPLGDTVMICLTPLKPEDTAPEALHFTRFRSQSADGAAAEIRAREQADQILLASFFLGSELWALYADYRVRKHLPA